MQIDPDQIKSSDNFLFVKAEHKILRIKFEDIVYIEGMREYIRIHLVEGKPVMTLVKLKNIEKSLAGNMFMRVHRSYIVSLNHIKTIERNRIVYDNNARIPVSGQYSVNFNRFLKDKFLT